MMQMPTAGEDGKNECLTEIEGSHLGPDKKGNGVISFGRKGKNPKHTLYFSRRELERTKSSVKEKRINMGSR